VVEQERSTLRQGTDGLYPGSGKERPMAVDTAGLVQVGRVEEITGPKVVSGGRHGIVVFPSDGAFYAVDNRCPHMGFPLHQGSVCNGILTCHWHHARFDLASGGTFDPWADDVRSYETVVEEGTVYVNPKPRPVDIIARQKERLRDGLEQDINLVMVKSVLGLMEAGAPPQTAVEIISDFGATYRDAGWRSGMTILAAMNNILDQLDRDDQVLGLYHGAVNVAADCAGEPPRFQLDPLPEIDVPFERLKAWFRQFLEVRDRDGAERALLSAVAGNASPEQLADMLFAAVTDHVYVDGGHTLDFINKSTELLDSIGWDNSATVLPSLLDGMAMARRSEELNNWRHPVDLVSMMEPIYPRLPELFERQGTGQWDRFDELAETLLGEDPEAIMREIVEAMEAGAALTQISQVLTYAAALRVAKFHTSNEFNDWITVLHTFTYCNGVHQGLKRAPSPELARGILHGAASLYLDRFLNMPSARLPEKRNADREPTDAGELLDRLKDHLNREQQVNESALTVHRYLSLGHDPNPLIAALGHTLLREDAEFHSYQMLEAGVQMFRELRHDRPEAASRVLVGVARYLAAHSPTPRAMLQTAKTAMRLQRGEEIYQDDAEE
jgi:nitrite reductase/ring-hydroxylating ferredoxin subunit